MTSKPRKLRFGFRCIDKQYIGASGCIGVASFQRRVETFGCDRVGASDNKDPIGATIFDRDPNALHHLVDGNHTLSLSVAAAARGLLIVDLHRGSAARS